MTNLQKTALVALVCLIVPGLTFFIFGRSVSADTCKNLAPEAQQVCYSRVIEQAKAAGSLSACTEMTSAPYKFSCVRGVAQVKKDTSICDSISTTEWRDECYSGVLDSIGDANLTLALCDNLPAGGSKYRCYYQVALRSSDLSVCDKIQDKETGTYYSSCYVYVGRALNDISVCEKPSVEQYACYSLFAETQKNPTLCEKINDLHGRDTCYGGYAQGSGDFSWCQKIVDSGARKLCVGQYGGIRPMQAHPM